MEETIININNSTPFISIFIGDFNARNTNWWANDISNSQGLDVEEIASHHGLKQVIDCPTHILPNSASFIDLIFTSQPNLVVESGVHHQIIFAKIRFKVHSPGEKASLFNDFFATQCTQINTSSILPPFFRLSNQTINTVAFDIKKINSLIKTLNPNKAHGWDEVFVRMIKICDESISPALKILFDNALALGIYPDKWKRANVVPIHKKECKTTVKNYRPISLLPIMGKNFEKCIYDSIYSHFEENNLFTPCQSSFRKNDSCVSQLLAITHEIFKKL